MEEHLKDLSDDTKAILLLCGTFSKDETSDISPFSNGEYAAVAARLRAMNLRPADIITSGTIPHLEQMNKPGITQERVEGLLKRGAAMAFALEKWMNMGLWVVSRGDEQYPIVLKQRLKHGAPPLLYGAGDMALLSRGGLAVAGSRDVDSAALDFTRDIGEACASEKIQVVSGAARGVDQEAMGACLEAGGFSVGVLANSLEKETLSRKWRVFLQEGRLALISPYYPAARFTVGRAMERNKYVYALSEWALVVASGFEKGGTWAGAIENLRHRRIPIFVRAIENGLPGNQALLKRGALPMREDWRKKGLSLREWLEEATHTGYDQGPTAADGERKLPGAVAMVREDSPSDQRWGDKAAGDKELDAFEHMIPLIEKALQSPLSEKEFAIKLNILPGQAKEWLKRAVKEGKIKKTKKPVLYVVGHDTQMTIPGLEQV
jgi:predicted Rossmann fold nucleotide-binding protein DprA/Smf involved in DNA uptake